MGQTISTHSATSIMRPSSCRWVRFTITVSRSSQFGGWTGRRRTESSIVRWRVAADPPPDGNRAPAAETWSEFRISGWPKQNAASSAATGIGEFPIEFHAGVAKHLP